MDFSDDTYRLKISAVFADMHLSVITASSRMVFSSRNIENLVIIKEFVLLSFLSYVDSTTLPRQTIWSWSKAIGHC